MDHNALRSKLGTQINQKFDKAQIQAIKRQKADEELRELDDQAKTVS